MVFELHNKKINLLLSDYENVIAEIFLKKSIGL
ncbi:hypothetical protein ABH942_001333 [Flavobacterium sp. 28YEA47A]